MKNYKSKKKPTKPRKSFLLNHVFLFTMFFAFSLYTKVAICQTYNAIDWGTYFNDNTHFPDFNYGLDDDVNDMAVSQTSPESVYIVGQTSAAPVGSLSVCSGNQTIDLHSENGFLAKYNSCGELIWSTYIGATAFCVALDIENGKKIIYVGGRAYSGNAFSCDGIGTPVFQATALDANNAFIAKYEDDDSTVTMLRWTYFKGTTNDTVAGSEAVHTIDIFHHHLFVCGDTFSGNIYLGAQHTGDTTYAGNGDGFMCEFDSLLSTLIYFTYIGGHDWDRSHDLKVYQSGNKPINIFVGGSTLSDDGIAMGTGFDLTYNGDNDTYLSKWEGNISGTFTQKWGTYIGGSGMEHGRRVAVDQKGNVFFTGWTGSADFPVTPFAFDTTYGGSGSNGLDGFVIKVSNTGQKLWCTYVGGNSKEEMGRSLLLFRKQGVQYVVIAGLTKSTSSSFPLVNPIQNLLNGNDSQQYYDEFISILTDPATSIHQQLVFSTYLGGSNEEHIGVGLYHPIIAFGPNQEIYISLATKSADIQQVIGSKFQDLVHPYNGSPDVFTAKLINTSNHHQFNCPLLKSSGSISSGNDEFNKLHIYPDPFDEVFTVEINSEIDAQSILEVMNSYGEIKFREDLQMSKGVNQVLIDLRNDAAGVYIVRIANHEKVIFYSVIKQ